WRLGGSFVKSRLLRLRRFGRRRQLIPIRRGPRLLAGHQGHQRADRALYVRRGGDDKLVALDLRLEHFRPGVFLQERFQRSSLVTWHRVRGAGQHHGIAGTRGQAPGVVRRLARSERRGPGDRGGRRSGGLWGRGRGRGGGRLRRGRSRWRCGRREAERAVLQLDHAGRLLLAFVVIDDDHLLLAFHFLAVRAEDDPFSLDLAFPPPALFGVVAQDAPFLVGRLALAIVPEFEGLLGVAGRNHLAGGGVDYGHLVAVHGHSERGRFFHIGLGNRCLGGRGRLVRRRPQRFDFG